MRSRAREPFSHTLTGQKTKSVTGIALVEPPPLRVAETARCNSPCKLAHTLSLPLGRLDKLVLGKGQRVSIIGP
jgi:hypothetical protein